jgi:hypothetical protein
VIELDAVRTCRYAGIFIILRILGGTYEFACFAILFLLIAETLEEWIMGKGSARRPTQVDSADFDRRWEETFAKDRMEPTKWSGHEAPGCRHSFSYRQGHVNRCFYCDERREE